MDILMYGGGAEGLGIAGCLVRPGIFGDAPAEPASFGCFTTLDQLSSEPYDFILVCTKSFDSVSASNDLAKHRHQIGKNVHLVLFQNR